RVRLTAVADTLLGHARRYAAPERIDVRVQALPEGALVTVRLDGVQADPDAAAALFEPFGAAASGDGNGLAMYVVRALVVASGGTVGIAGSRGEHPATVLWARLPLLEPVPASRPTALPSPREEPS
ncbi:MAG: Sensory box histidine kinase/response regulator, partial [Frankiales bacterium]|nr:Sensory box histidine kinase/response regulator [Frankiales bacterium]